MSAGLTTASYAVGNFEESIENAKEEAKTLFPEASAEIQDAFGNSIGKSGEEAFNFSKVSGSEIKDIQKQGIEQYLEDLAAGANMSIEDFAATFNTSAAAEKRLTE